MQSPWPNFHNEWRLTPRLLEKNNILVTVEEYEKWGFVFFSGYLWPKISLSRREARCTELLKNYEQCIRNFMLPFQWHCEPQLLSLSLWHTLWPELEFLNIIPKQSPYSGIPGFEVRRNLKIFYFWPKQFLKTDLQQCELYLCSLNSLASSNPTCQVYGPVQFSKSLKL